MTQEEKARAYDKALEKIKYVMGHGVQPVLNKEDLQDIFPELKESEDERIRKNCIHFLELQKSHHAATFEIEECIAWLEKQARSTTITIPEDLKGTDTDGGVVGEKGKKGEV